MGSGESALAKIAAFAISLISMTVSYKFFDISGWETYAYLGSSLLFFVITMIIGAVFKTGLLPAMLVSAFITALVMGPVLVDVSFVMIAIALIIIVILAIAKVYEEREL